MKIYHNPRCRKSRETLNIIEQHNLEVEIIEYLKYPPDKKTLMQILKKLGMRAEEIIRKNEAIWKENYKGKEYSEEQLIDILTENPKLIERPIVVSGKKAILGRPPENVLSLLD